MSPRKSLDELRHKARKRPRDLPILSAYVEALVEHIDARWGFETPAEDEAAPAVMREFADAARRLSALDPSEHAIVLDALERLADLLHERREYEAAREVFDEWLRVARGFREADPEDANARIQLAEALSSYAEFAEGREQAELAAACRDEQIGLLRTLVADGPARGVHAMSLNRSLEDRATLHYRSSTNLAAARADAEEALEIVRCRRFARGDAGRLVRQLVLLSRIAQKQQDWAGAIRASEERAAATRRVLDADPEDADANLDLGDALMTIGDMKRNLGDWPGAIAAWEQSVAHHRALFGKGLDDARLALRIAIALPEIRDARATTGEKAEALVAAREAVVFARRVAADDPTDLDMVRDLVVDLDELGDHLFDAGDGAGASGAYEEAESLVRNLVATEPENARWRDDLAIVLGRRARLASDSGDAAAAAGHFGEAVTEYRVLAVRQPDVAKWRRKLGDRLAHLGGALLDAGDREGALAAYEEAVGLLVGTRGAEDGASDDLIRETLSEAADAASSAGRPDLAAAFRQRASEVGGGGSA